MCGFLTFWRLARGLIGTRLGLRTNGLRLEGLGVAETAIFSVGATDTTAPISLIAGVVRASLTNQLGRPSASSREPEQLSLIAFGMSRA